MLKNYIKIAWRNLIRNKTYSVITLFGLACGMVCAILLTLYVRDELSFDRYHKNADVIFRVNVHIKWADNEFRLGHGSPPMGPALRQEYPEVKNMLRIKSVGENLFRVGDKALYVKESICADSSLFSFFDYTFSEGTPESALRNPYAVVLTQKLALSLFGKTTGLLGKVVTVKDNIPFTVSGIISNVPPNHHLKFDAILPYTNLQVSGVKPDSWDSFNSSVYVMLNQAADVKRLEHKMGAFYKKYIAKALGDNGETNATFDITFQPLADIHLRSTHLMGEENGSNLSYVYTFSIIGLFILLIAIVNYINLATARSAGRAREIGIRKAIGSPKMQLIGQFLSESMLSTYLSLFISMLLVYAVLPFFNSITDKALKFDVFDIQTTIVLAVFALILGLVSGIYPAFILSGFNPVVVLKGAVANAGKGALLRKSLVVVQFSISMMMIVGTIVVYRQLRYMEDTELGFNTEQVLTIPLKSPAVQKAAESLKNKLLQNSAINSVSLIDGSVGEGMNNKSTFFFFVNGKEEAVSSEYFRVDHDFLEVLQVNLKDGRNFNQNMVADSVQEVIVNEAMLKRLKWKDRTVGLVEINGKNIPITGVVKDFHLRSLHDQIEPLVLVRTRFSGDNLVVRISPQNISATLALLKETYNEVVPGQPFEYQFLDQTFAKQYESDERKGSLFLTFSGIAIFISCLGLYGLTTFTAHQRTKEIGVRKVLGGSVKSIVMLLSGDFLKLIIFSIVAATPVAWYVMHKWLQQFPYRITVEWWVFVVAGTAAIAIAICTISFQSVKAALMNPVKTLKRE
ncbi:ABC transporter permease [Dyadobacter sp. 32]|uniref:ABC transporter permease n=1 Tax=Dyadobacter sp. 32 TaxID=538966 RepID=UPI0011EC5D6C